jgi:hypothetical protein
MSFMVVGDSQPNAGGVVSSTVVPAVPFAADGVHSTARSEQYVPFEHCVIRTVPALLIAIAEPELDSVVIVPAELRTDDGVNNCTPG